MDQEETVQASDEENAPVDKEKSSWRKKLLRDVQEALDSNVMFDEKGNLGVVAFAFLFGSLRYKSGKVKVENSYELS